MEPRFRSARADPLASGSPLSFLRSLALPLATSGVARRIVQEPNERRHVSAFLAELVGAPQDDTEDLPALQFARTDPIVMADQIKLAVADLLGGAVRGARVLLLEDVQWADASSLAYLEAALRRAGPATPILVVALARPELLDTSPRLFADMGQETLHLAPLSAKASKELVVTALGESEHADRIAKLAGGNAFYLEELIRSVAEGSDELPETVLAMAEARIGQLDASERRVLRAASVFGGVFWESAVASLVGLSKREVASRLESLERKELVVLTPSMRFPQERAFSFRHDLVREAAYGMLTAADRKAAHRGAAEWLAARGERDAWILASHFDRGGLRLRAVPYHARAAQLALEGNDWKGAVAATEAAEEGGARGIVLGELLAVRASASSWLGEQEAMTSTARRALSLVAGGSDQWWRTQRVLFSAMANGGNLDFDAVDAVERGLGRQPSSFAVASAAHCAECLFYGGAEGVAEGRRLLERIERLDPAMLRQASVACKVANARAMAAYVDGDMGEYLECSKRALAAATMMGTLRLIAQARMNTGCALLAVGQPEAARDELRKASEEAARLEIHGVKFGSLLNLGQALLALGDYDAARAALEPALEFHRRSSRLRAVVLVALAVIELRRDRLESALGRIAEARKVPRLNDATRAFVFANEAEILLAARRDEDALRVSTEAMRQSRGAMIDGAVQLRWVHARCLVACGKSAEASAVVARAKESLREAAEKITNASHRETFLKRIEENAGILALAARFGV